MTTTTEHAEATINLEPLFMATLITGEGESVTVTTVGRRVFVRSAAGEKAVTLDLSGDHAVMLSRLLLDAKEVASPFYGKPTKR